MVKYKVFLGGFTSLISSASTTPDTFEDIAKMHKNILMAVPSAVINAGKFQDMPERSFGLLISLDINGSTAQFYVRDYTIDIYCRDINGGSGTVSPWYKLTKTVVTA